MSIAEIALAGSQLKIDVSADVNETAAIVYAGKQKGGRSAVVIFGGGSPKNFLLQTEPQIQEILGIKEKGHDYFLQFTDARPDTGGLSGATPSEAASWGKSGSGSAARCCCGLRGRYDRHAFAYFLYLGEEKCEAAQAAIRPQGWICRGLEECLHQSEEKKQS